MHDKGTYLVISRPSKEQFERAVLDIVPSVLRIKYQCPEGREEEFVGTLHTNITDLLDGGWIVTGEDRWISDLHEGYQSYSLEVSQSGNALLHLEAGVIYGHIRS